MRSHHTGVAIRRLAVVRALLLFGFAALAGRAAHLAVVDERGAHRGVKQTVRVLTLAPERGAIFDRNHDALALDINAPSVYAIHLVRDDWKATARQLAPVLGMSTKNLEGRLRERRSFGFLARWVSNETADRVRALGLPGIGVLTEPRRSYPHRELASRVLGFANIDRKGVRGVEQLENDWLSGVARRIPVERDASGRLMVRNGGESFETSGGDIALTIDAKLQADAESALAAALERTGAKGGIVVSMDPHSGEILALAEAPRFDPNHFRELRFATTRSRAFLDAAEPGSTMKVFLIASALEAGAIEASDTFDCENGRFRVPGKTVRDHHPHRDLTVADILRVSSNIGAVKIAYRLGRRAHFDGLRRFGFGTTTGSGFPDESSGLLRNWIRWREIDHATIAYGHGVNVTAVQLATAFSAIANGGMLPVPRLVLARRAAGHDWERNSPKAPTRVVSADNAAAVMAMLEGVVGPDGTAKQAGLRDLAVAGKTGTAEKWNPEAHRYDGDRFTAWFMGAVPAGNPRLVIVAALDEPRRPTHSGGAAAAPLFAEVASAQLVQFGIDTIPQPRKPIPHSPNLVAARTTAAPDTAAHTTERVDSGPTNGANRELPEITQLGSRVLMPDLTGLSIAQVRKITAETRLVVELSGSGWAVSQEPSPGTVMYGHGPVLRVRFSNRTRRTPDTEG